MPLVRIPLVLCQFWRSHLWSSIVFSKKSGYCAFPIVPLLTLHWFCGGIAIVVVLCWIVMFVFCHGWFLGTVCYVVAMGNIGGLWGSCFSTEFSTEWRFVPVPKSTWYSTNTWYLPGICMPGIELEGRLYSNRTPGTVQHTEVPGKSKKCHVGASIT